VRGLGQLVIDPTSTIVAPDKGIKDSSNHVLIQELKDRTEHTIVREQRKEPFASAMHGYLTNKELPKNDIYMKNKILGHEESYAVTEEGVLCRLWYRDPRKRNILDPVYQIYVPETLRGAVVKAMHGGYRSGHLSPMKTWQKMRERFYWPGMFADVYQIVRECGVCQSRGRKPPKQKIQGHVRSDVPGEVWVLDVLYFPESKRGNKYALTMIDVASRWAHIVPIENVTAANVMRVVEDRIIGDGISPNLFITDNGSEFKKEFLDFCDLYRIKVRKSVPHHAEGHGMVEAFNRTIADIIGHMIEEDGGDWEENLPWARRAYLSSVHTALQSRSVGLSPAEAFRGWVVHRPLDIAIEGKPSGEVGEEDMDRVVRMKDKLEKAARWAMESRLDYERLMEGTRRNRQRGNRIFKEGDKVRIYKPPRSKTERKVGRVFVGPYIVIKAVKRGGVVSEYVVRREGSTGQSNIQRVTAERMRSYVDAKTTAGELVDHSGQIETLDTAPTKEWEVESILDEIGSMKSGNKRYLVKWKGDYENSWEPEKLINAPDLITDFHTKKHKYKLISPVMRSPIKLPPRHTITLDLLRTEPAQLIKIICQAANCTVDDIAIVWASPPCRTFSPADYSNITRNNNFRNHNDPLKPPTATNPLKAQIAREHDNLVQHLLYVVEYLRSIGGRFKCGIENPRGSLQQREYMQPEMLPKGIEKDIVDQCAFGRDYRKTTHVWNDIKSWTPTGSTGNGRCGGIP